MNPWIQPQNNTVRWGQTSEFEDKIFYSDSTVISCPFLKVTVTFSLL